MTRTVDTIREPISREASDVDPKLVKGGVAAVVVGAVLTALAKVYLPDLDLDHAVVTGVSSGLVAAVYAGVGYATKSFRRKRIADDPPPPTQSTPGI